jgi:ketosteroid isomerase-like protein
MNSVQAEAFALKFREAVASGDPEKIRALVSADVQIWYNQFGGSTDTIGREQGIEIIRRMRSNVTEFAYAHVRVHPTPDGYVQESIVTCTTKGGVNMTVPVCLVARIGPDGKLVRYDEYRDSAHTAPLKSELEQAAAKPRVP